MHAHQICETTAVVSEAKHSGRNEGESMLGRPDSKGAFVPFKDIQKAAAKGEEPSTSEHTAAATLVQSATRPAVAPEQAPAVSTAQQGKAEGREALSEEAKLKKRRQQDAERKRRQRAMASEEAKRREREKDAQRKRDKRAQIISSSPEELKLRRERDAERMRKKRAQASPRGKEVAKDSDSDKRRKTTQEECEAGASSKASPPGELDGKE